LKIQLVPLLQVQRDLYTIPRGGDRFRRYLEAMTGGTRDMVLPLALMNPMGKEHVADTLDALLAIDAEGVATSAVEAARRHSEAPEAALLGLPAL